MIEAMAWGSFASLNVTDGAEVRIGGGPLLPLKQSMAPRDKIDLAALSYLK
ncbi:hypothetical protein [Brevundimonas sp.]|uniref:hypothetical protein n=1 Tax=Brevundimonas sp. TaxID=1871086 RepID=UPI00286B251F|nr:hypothetical protein [Brevundimonas sp.]